MKILLWKKHIYSCKNKGYKGIEVWIQDYYEWKRPRKSRKYKPTVNFREECSEFRDLLC